jgi:hypothetical protein
MGNVCCRSNSENLTGSKSKERIFAVDNLEPDTGGNLPSKDLCALDTSDTARSKLNSAVKVLIRADKYRRQKIRIDIRQRPRALQVTFPQK